MTILKDQAAARKIAPLEVKLTVALEGHIEKAGTVLSITTHSGGWRGAERLFASGAERVAASGVIYIKTNDLAYLHPTSRFEGIPVRELEYRKEY